MERVCHLANKIYREMLCITRHEGKTHITKTGGLDHIRVSAFSWIPSPQHTTFTFLGLAGLVMGGGYYNPLFFLLFLLQLRSYLVPCISSRIFILPKLQNIYWSQFVYGELFSRQRTIFLTVILLDSPQKVIPVTI